MTCSRRRLYQYNEDDFRFELTAFILFRLASQLYPKYSGVSYCYCYIHMYKFANLQILNIYRKIMLVRKN